MNHAAVTALFTLRNAIRKRDIPKIDSALFAFVEHGYCFNGTADYLKRYRLLKEKAISILKGIDRSTLSVSTQVLLLQDEAPIIPQAPAQAAIIPVTVPNEPEAEKPVKQKLRKLNRVFVHPLEDSYPINPDTSLSYSEQKAMEVKHKSVLNFISNEQAG